MSAAAAKKLVLEWGTADVGLWLRSLDSKFDRYTSAFEKAGVDGSILLSDIGEADLKELISLPTHRTKVLVAIAHLRASHRSSPTAKLNAATGSGSGGKAIRTPIEGNASHDPSPRQPFDP